MKEIVLYIASSMDGYIADKNGSVNWLESFEPSGSTDYGYENFYKTIDTTLIGYNTYKQILGFGVDFPYKDKTNYVISKNKQESAEYVSFVSKNIINFIQTLQKASGKNIWLVGGGTLNSTLLENNLINKIILFLFPVTLCEGIPLFKGSEYQSRFELLETKTYDNGVIKLVYTKSNR